MHNLKKDSFFVTVIGERGQTAFETFEAAEKFIQNGIADRTVGIHGAFLDSFVPRYSRRHYTERRFLGIELEMPH